MKPQKQLPCGMQRFNDINKLMFVSEKDISEQDLSGEFRLLSGDIIASVASVYERSIGSAFQFPPPK